MSQAPSCAARAHTICHFTPTPVLSYPIYQIIYILYSIGRARVTCTGYVHCKSLHRALGAPGQSRSINQPILSINSSIYTF